MAYVKKRFFDNNSMSNPSNLLDFLLLSGVPATLNDSTVVIMIADSFQISIAVGKAGYWRYTMSLTVNGVTTETGYVYNYCTATCVYDNNLFYLLFAGAYDNRATCVFLEKISSDWYYGYMGLGGIGEFYPITSLTLTRLGGVSGYQHSAVLNFSTPIGTISYTTDFLFLNSVAEVQDANTISCTTITGGSVITIEGNNYFALSNNTLVLMTN